MGLTGAEGNGLDSQYPSCYRPHLTSSLYSEGAKMVLHLLGLPHEVLHGIFVNTDPQGLARLCCCRALNDFIKNDRLLYKELYLKYFVSFPGA